LAVGDYRSGVEKTNEKSGLCSSLPSVFLITTPGVELKRSGGGGTGRKHPDMKNGVNGRRIETDKSLPIAVKGTRPGKSTAGEEEKVRS